MSASNLAPGHSPACCGVRSFPWAASSAPQHQIVMGEGWFDEGRHGAVDEAEPVGGGRVRKHAEIFETHRRELVWREVAHQGGRHGDALVSPGVADMMDDRLRSAQLEQERLQQ